MTVDLLYPLVSEAIRRAETLEDLQAPGAHAAYLDLSLLEERIADALPASDPEGGIARRGAVRAAIAAEDFARARDLVERFLAEVGEGDALRGELAELSRRVELSDSSSERKKIEPSGIYTRRYVTTKEQQVEATEQNASNKASAEDQKAWGLQLIADFFGCDERICNDLDRIYEFLDKFSLFLGSEKQTQPYVFKVCEITFPGEPGVSGWIPLQDGSIQIRTSANDRFITIDVSYRLPFSSADVIAYMEKWFSPSRIDTHIFQRGIGYRRKGFEDPSVLARKRA